MGIDIGATTSKGVISRNGILLAYGLLPSGSNYRTTAQELREELLRKGEVSENQIAFVLATGQGAKSVYFSNSQTTDIRCCARGINRLLPSVKTVIDVGTTCSRVIRVGEQGQVNNFVTSEKCAAGSGYFLELVSNVLRIDLSDMGPLSLKSKDPVMFTVGCAVFGESEAISRVAEGFPVEDILAGVHKALADKISALSRRIGMEEPCAITGGGALDSGLVKSLEEEFGFQLQVPENPQIITALGASLMAEEMGGKERRHQASR